MIKILVIGKGGREHAIAWKIAQSPLAEKVFVAPGNDGMATNSKISLVPIGEGDQEGLLKFALKENIRLVVIGPEGALLNGLSDRFEGEGISVFGPSKAAALLEGSKHFAKEIMKKYHIPTASFEIFSEYHDALAYVKQNPIPIVIKYDGLAAGKGVVVAQSMEEAEKALKEMLLDDKFGKGKVVIEEFLEGPEFSLIALVNGERVEPLVIAQDHKRAYDGDAGPNTGGMGAYTPVPLIPEKEIQKAINTIMKPMAEGMVKEEIPFVGALYGGLILTAAGSKVIEFNVRFGDPETEVILPKMKSDLLQHLLDILHEKPTTIEWHDEVFLGVVMASTGYPESANKGGVIRGLENVENLVFHMGTALKNGEWITDGGRVLFVVGSGKTFKEAQKDAYRGVAQIESESLFYRKDIGYQVIKAE